MHSVWFTVTGLRDFSAFDEAVLAPTLKLAKGIDKTIKFEPEPGRGLVRVRITGASSRAVGRARRLLNLEVIKAGGAMKLGR